MGGGAWSNNEYEDRAATRKATGKSAFNYTDSVMASTPVSARRVHEMLDPKGVKFRESRDSVEHPNSKAIGVLFDVTGSMGDTPRRLQEKLPKLMSMILQKGALVDPQILFGAIGDGHCDRGPLQVGQFESDIKMEEHLGNLWLEGGGGGSSEESYDLAMYFMARHTAMDCLEKRGEKGYLFLMGDEKYYRTVSKSIVKEFIGDTLQDDIKIEDIVAELQEKFEVFFIFTPSAGYGLSSGHPEIWKKLFAERVLLLPNTDAVCETIAATIAMCEGAVDHSDLDLHLADVGVDARTAATVKNALIPLAGRNLAKADVKGNLVGSGASSGLSSV